MANNKLCMFQMMRASDGTRSDPYSMSVGKLAEHLKRIPIEEIKDDFVLVLMEFGEVDPAATDYGAISKNGVFSTAPVLTVQNFLALFGGE